MKTEIENLKGQIVSLEEDLQTALDKETTWPKPREIQNNNWDLAEETATKVVEKLQEKEEREKRKNNLILFNVPESNKEEGKDREKEDVEVCEDLFSRNLQVESFRIEKVIRLGKKTQGRHRPTMVKMEEEKTKWHIVAQGKKLRDSTNAVIQKIGIAPDLTREQREEQKRLRNLLDEKRLRGGRWGIRRGRVVDLDKPNREETYNRNSHNRNYRPNTNHQTRNEDSPENNVDNESIQSQVFARRNSTHRPSTGNNENTTQEERNQPSQEHPERVNQEQKTSGQQPNGATGTGNGQNQRQ
ncbi:hypothetical protein Pmani_009115 [Petrolisthes manimaculis]|uniref:Uncharacterized protein n=1 Tax=Petrolisthes manimaculis TaxID=1843537 RepID=A0AAE1Q4X3_9EUCA|nr:hypothetical protein Pmani_009115 [Petrolisthes manimaculis]